MRRNFFVIFISVVLLLSLCLCSCSGETVETTQSDIQPQIPEDYVTYTDEAGVFSISYPPEWEPALHLLAIREQHAKEYVNNLDENIPVEKASIIFFAGLAAADERYSPNCGIVIEPLKYNISNIDIVCESEILGIKKYAKKYDEISREKTIIDGKEAIIVQNVQTMPEESTLYMMNMFVVVDNSIWTVGCTALNESEYRKWEEDFNNIVRSLRILK
jgi:hypothetical protein